MNRIRGLRGLICILIVLAVLGAIPVMDVEVVPEWSVVLKDSDDAVVAGAVVNEVWTHYSLEFWKGQHYDKAVSDEMGRISFPARSIRISILQLVAAKVRDVVASVNPHSSYGPDAYIVCQTDNTSCGRSYKPDSPQPTIVHVSR